jgi:hypothetical protein
MAALGSIMLLATTNHMCEDVAVVPFLWVLPLSLYLITFIIAFSEINWYRRVWCMPLFVVSCTLACIGLRPNADFPFALQITMYVIALFTGCMICHGELVRVKPKPKYLTTFYLAVAGGGAIGGIFVALVAPVLFAGYWEFYIALQGIALLTLARLFFDRTSPLYSGKRLWIWIPLLLMYSGLTAALLRTAVEGKSGALEASRSFYGVLHVTTWSENDKGRYRELLHGGIIHGIQYLGDERREQPTTYYGKGTGVWLAINHHPRRVAQKPIRIGVIGLGIGTIAALGRKGDLVRFYEINPDVVSISREWFTYLQDTPAQVEIILGDARIQLERELEYGQYQQFDVLIVDAFSSGTIPIHLLTRECAQLYKRHLRPDGILAINISNDYLDLFPVMYGLARDLGWETMFVDSDANFDVEAWAATWALITSNNAFIEAPAIKKARTDGSNDSPDPLLWTDDYTSLFHVLSW